MDLAQGYDKSIVIILAFDDNHKLLHTTTYAVKPEDRGLAAALGVTAAGAVGADLTQAKHYEKLPKDDDKV